MLLSRSFCNKRRAVTFRGWDVVAIACGVLTGTVGVWDAAAGANEGQISEHCRHGSHMLIDTLPPWNCPIIQGWIAQRLHHIQFWGWSVATHASPWQGHSVIRANMAAAGECSNASELSTCCQSELSEKMWHRQTLNGTKVHVLTASPSVITDVFVHGCLAGTNVYTNLSQWLWPSALLLNL